MIFNSARTIYNVKLQTCKLLDLEYTPLVNTTLNEKLNIYPNYVFDKPTMPKLNLITVGGGGIPIINNDVLDLKRSKHGSKDGALFKMLPLLIKPYNTPLSDIESSVYRLKTTETINEIHYDIYYGMVTNSITYDPRIYKIKSTEINLNTSILDTSLDDTILNPVIKLGTLDNDSNYDYIINTCKLGINIDKQFMNNIIHALSIKFPYDNITTLTEIGICSSVDTAVDGRTEAIWTQINYFIDLDLDVQMLNTKIKQDGSVYLNVDIGGMEPLMI